MKTCTYPLAVLVSVFTLFFTQNLPAQRLVPFGGGLRTLGQPRVAQQDDATGDIAIAGVFDQADGYPANGLLLKKKDSTVWQPIGQPGAYYHSTGLAFGNGSLSAPPE